MFNAGQAGLPEKTPARGRFSFVMPKDYGVPEILSMFVSAAWGLGAMAVGFSGGRSDHYLGQVLDGKTIGVVMMMLSVWQMAGMLFQRAPWMRRIGWECLAAAWMYLTLSAINSPHCQEHAGALLGWSILAGWCFVRMPAAKPSSNGQ